MINLPRKYLSWSQFDLYRRSPKEYYRRYILGEFPPSNQAMRFGSRVHKAIAEDYDGNDELLKAVVNLTPKYKEPETKIVVQLDEIKLLGYIDSFNPETKDFLEYKTGKTKWTQKRVDNHGQIDFYSLMIFQKYKIVPKAKLIWIRVDKGLTGDIFEFKAQRTLEQLLNFSLEVKKTSKEISKLYDGQNIC